MLLFIFPFEEITTLSLGPKIKSPVRKLYSYQNHFELKKCYYTFQTRYLENVTVYKEAKNIKLTVYTNILSQDYALLFQSGV